MGIWDNENRFQRQQLLRSVQVMERVAKAHGLNDVQTHEGSRELTLNVPALERQVSALTQVQDATERLSSSVDDLRQVESENGVILSRIEDGVERNYEVQVHMSDTLEQSLAVQGMIALMTREGVELLGEMVEELGEVNVHLANNTTIGLEAVRLQAVAIEQRRQQHDLSRRELREQHELDRTIVVQSAQFIADRQTQSTLLHMQSDRDIARAQDEAIDRRQRAQDESDDRRLKQLIAAQPSFENRANEKYAHAVTQFDTGNHLSCVEDLEAVLKEKSTHVRAWILYGMCAFHRALPAMAKAALRKAADFALHDKLMELYVDAMTRFSRLERFYGNHAEGLTLLKEAIDAVEEDSPLYIALCYEEVQALFVNPNRTESLQDIAYALRDVLIMDPKRRDEVATSPFWAEVVATDPCLRYGNAPFIRLMETWMEMRAEAKPGIQVTYEGRAVLPLPRADMDVYVMVLEGCRAGKDPLPQAVREHLAWMQDLLFDSKEGVLIKPETKKFFSGYEQLLLFLSQRTEEVLEKGPMCGTRHMKTIRRGVRTNGATHFWRYDGERAFLPLVEFKRFKLSIKDKSVDEAVEMRIKTELRRILRARPELRDEVAASDLFAACRDRCPWLESGNNPIAELAEAVWLFSVNDRIPPLLFGTCADWLAQAVTGLLTSVGRAIREANWGREKLSERDRQLFKEVQPLILRLADAWQPEANDQICAIARNEAERILFFSLMAEPCEDPYGLSEFKERLDRVYVALPDARAFVMRSLLFKEYRDTGELAQQTAEREEAARLVARAAEEARRIALAEQEAHEVERIRLMRLAQEKARQEEVERRKLQAKKDAEEAERKWKEVERVAKEARQSSERRRIASDSARRAKLEAVEKEEQKQKREKRINLLIWASVCTVLIALAYIYIPWG